MISWVLAAAAGFAGVVFRTGPTVTPHSTAWIATDAMLPAGWQQMYFTHAQMHQTVRRNYSHALRCFEALQPWAFKADLFRLLLLYSHGGMWLDYSTTLLRPISCLNCSHILVRDRLRINGNACIANGLMGAAKPRSAFIGAAIRRVLTNCRQRYYGINPLDVSGPCMLARTARDNPPQNVLWLQHRRSGGFIDNLKGQAVAMTKQPGHDQTIVNNSRPFQAYNIMWHQRAVYS